MGKYSVDKNVDSLVCELLDKGWQPLRRKRHWQIVSPTGNRLTVPITPSDGRAWMNFRGDVRRLTRQGESNETNN
jgi:predicted RNA binding protein YcfA (HicA-like mRNA interferase family)